MENYFFKIGNLFFEIEKSKSDNMVIENRIKETKSELWNHKSTISKLIYKILWNLFLGLEKKKVIIFISIMRFREPKSEIFVILFLYLEVHFMNKEIIFIFKIIYSSYAYSIIWLLIMWSEMFEFLMKKVFFKKFKLIN